MKNTDKQQCLTGPQAYTPREEHLYSSESTAQSKHSAHKLHIKSKYTFLVKRYTESITSFTYTLIFLNEDSWVYQNCIYLIKNEVKQ